MKDTGRNVDALVLGLERRLALLWTIGSPSALLAVAEIEDAAAALEADGAGRVRCIMVPRIRIPRSLQQELFALVDEHGGAAGGHARVADLAGIKRLELVSALALAGVTRDVLAKLRALVEARPGDRTAS